MIISILFLGQTNLHHSYLQVLLAKTNITNSANQEENLNNMTNTLIKLFEESNCYYIRTLIIKVLNKVGKANEIHLDNTDVDR